MTVSYNKLWKMMIDKKNQQNRDDALGWHQHECYGKAYPR